MNQIPLVPAAHVELKAMVRPALDPVLVRFARLAAHLLNAPLAAVCVRDSGGEVLGSGVSPANGLTPALSAMIEIARSHDPAAARWVESFDQRADSAYLLGVGIHAVLAVPVRRRDGAIRGTVVVADVAPRAWTAADSSILQDLSASALLEAEVGARPGAPTRTSGDSWTSPPARSARLPLSPAHEEMRATDLAFMRAVLDAQRDAIYVKDLHGRYLLCNARLSEMAGRAEADVIGKEDWEIFPADLACAIRDSDQQVISRGEAEIVELVLVTPTVTRKFEDWKSPYRNQAGEIAGVVGIARDVTALRAREEELKLRERQLADAERVAMLGSWECSGEEGHVVWSEQMYEIFGIDSSSREMHTLEGYLEHVHPSDRGRTRDIIEAALATGASFEFEHRICRDGGDERVVLSRGAVSRNENGSTRMVGTCQDITASRNAEKAIRTAMAEAERANEAKSSFLSRMSHELRTPLNAILGFGQVMQSDPSIEDRESVEQILSAGMHLLGLVDEMLDLAKIEAGKMEVSPEPTSLCEVGRVCLELIRPMAEAASVTLVAGGGLAEDRYVIADSRRLKQVMLNLLSNAIKYNHRGGRVVLNCEAAASDRLRLTVQDTGPGLDPQQVAGLFNPFERMGAERSRIQGTGLGLSVSRGLAEVMGGVLGVNSTPGEGSTFWIEFAEAYGASPTLPADPMEPEAPQGPTLRGKIVYIEDNPANLRLVQRILARRTDLELLSATTGAGGLELVRAQRPDLVLLDVQLPDVDGDEVLWRLQQDPELRQIPVVAISGDATPAQIKRLLDLGAQEYVTKPFQVEKLLETIDRMLASEG